jgi:hypothetical protein
MNLIQIGPEVTLITHYMYFSELGGFAPTSRHTFPRRHLHYLGPEVGDDRPAIESQKRTA